MRVATWTGVAGLVIAQVVFSGAKGTVPGEPPPLSIVVLGDSNSTPDPYFDAWWEYLSFSVPQWSLHFVGWPGAKLLVDGPTQLASALELQPDLVLVMLGTNDVPNATAAEILAGYQGLREAAAPTPVVFIGPIEVQPWAAFDPTLANAKIAELQVGLDLLGALDPECYKLPVDGLHLDGEGQRVVGYLALAHLLDRYVH